MPSACAPALGKRSFAESHASALGNISTLPSASWRHSAIFHLCRVLAGGTRQKVDAVSPPDGRRTAGARAGHVLGLCRVPPNQHSAKEPRCIVAECLDLPRACIRQRPGMPCARFLPSVRGLALGKPHLCRVPVVWHSAKTQTLGNYRFSGSALRWLLAQVLLPGLGCLAAVVSPTSTIFLPPEAVGSSPALDWLVVWPRGGSGSCSREMLRGSSWA